VAHSQGPVAPRTPPNRPLYVGWYELHPEVSLNFQLNGRASARHLKRYYAKATRLLKQDEKIPCVSSCVGRLGE
jgi:hypothetical protein